MAGTRERESVGIGSRSAGGTPLSCSGAAKTARCGLSCGSGPYNSGAPSPWASSCFIRVNSSRSAGRVPGAASPLSGGSSQAWLTVTIVQRCASIRNRNRTASSSDLTSAALLAALTFRAVVLLLCSGLSFPSFRACAERPISVHRSALTLTK